MTLHFTRLDVWQGLSRLFWNERRLGIDVISHAGKPDVASVLSSRYYNCRGWTNSRKNIMLL